MQNEHQPPSPETPPQAPPESASDAAAAPAKTTGGRPPFAPPPPPVLPTNIKDASAETIAEAVELLRRGEVVAFPTETVYGLGADAANPDAVAKIFKLKGRPEKHPLIVHVPDASHMEQWGREVPESACALARAFWPGPLTIVLKRAQGVLDAVTGGQDTIAVRVPSHPIARELITAFGGGIAAPSANKFGRVSPTLAKHVFSDFQLTVPLILDGGPAKVGIESTIVDCTGETPRILRPGGITAVAIEQILGEPLATSTEDAPRVSGSLPAHYAPRAALRIAKRLEILEMLGHHKGRRVAVLALEVSVPRLAQSLQRVVPVIAADFQRELYGALREFDAAGADVIIVEAPPRSKAWIAIWDRLERAAAAHPPKPAKKERLEAERQEP
jgi:L-threonylcarbamoyladenylate synthase